MMPATKLTPLHLASSLEELQKQATVPPNSKPNMLVKTSKKLLESAESAEESGDQEKAYVLYTKYFLLAKLIYSSSDYKKDKIYYDSMVPPKSAASTMTKLENLSNSLEQRYKEKQDIAMAERKAKVIAIKPPSNVAAVNGFSKHHVEEKQDEKESHVIDAMALYSLIQKKSTSFLLLDARPAQDYKASHIKHPSSLNVPEECLRHGATVKAIEKQLHVEDRSQWARKTMTDMLIMYDWTSEEFTPESPLMVLQKALFHWDVASGTKYKSPPYLLKGGFEHFALSYPMLVTNPQKTRPPSLASGKKTNAAINIDSLEYPDLDNAFIVTPSASPAAPTASLAVASGAISVSNADMEVVSSPSKPKIPDRKSKPTSMSSLDSKSTLNPLDTAYMEDSSARASTEVSEVNRSIPTFDRSLKAKFLLSNKANDLGEVLEAENDIVEDSLRIEAKQLELENQWDILRLRRENEANEGLRQEVMAREEALISEMNNLALEKEKKETENILLLKQLEQLKAQLRQRDEDFVVQDKIRLKTEKKRQLERDVERKRRERKKQLEKDQQNMEAMLEQKRRLEEARRKREETENAIRTKITSAKLKPSDEMSNSGKSLNRSHSSPNIAKMLDDEVASNASSFPTPKFDRTSKPSSIEVKNRNFAAVWGTGKRGLTGLRNLGNTCYMNSLLQCLSNFTLPSQYFIGENFKNDLNRSSDTRGEVAIEFAEVIRMMWSGQYKSIAPIDFKRVVGKFNDMFRGSDQQDAHELLLILMEFLHQDVNEVRSKVKVPEQKNDNVPEIEAAQRSWEMEKKADKSFIRETFYGQQRSTLRCPSCGWVSVTYESFFELPLKLPSGNKRCTLRQLIDTYLSEDTVPYKCPTCKKERQCSKRFEIVKLPLILTISLGRFYNDGLSRKKQNFVDFELTDVNLGQYATGCNGQLNRYKDYTLYGVCNHFGSLESGHYTAFCYSQVYEKWYKYDDTEVYEMDASDVKSPAAYILFYSARN